MKRLRVVFSIAAVVSLLAFAGLCWNAAPVAAGPSAQVTLTPRPQLTPPPDASDAGDAASAPRPPRLHGAILDWGRGNMPAGVKVTLRGDGWEIQVETDESGEYRFQDIGNEVAFLSADVPDDREDLSPLTTDLPVRIQVDHELIVNLAFYAQDVTPEPLIDIKMSSAADEAAPDGNVSFTISVSNQWDQGISQLIVADYLPEGLTYVNATTSQGKVVQDRGLVWVSLGTLPPESSATVTILAKVDPDVKHGATITNRAVAYHSENVAVQAESQLQVVNKLNGVLPVTGVSPLLPPVVGIVLIVLAFGVQQLRRRAR